MSAYSESDMMQRWDSAAKKAVAATQPQPFIGRKPRKPDPLLTNNFQGKTFNGVGAEFDKKHAVQKDYLYDKKSSSTSQFGTRSFFGLKNPWFGKKVMHTDKASLLTKSDVALADKQFPIEAASTKEFYQAKKKANERMEPVQTGSTKVEAKQQGLLNSITQQKNLSVEQVRELLNKQ
jgi:actin-related protein